jgi:hypothetical protein
MYTKRIRPGLTETNRQKQIDFCKHVHNRWGLAENAKYLWTMSDEKWWFGLVARTFAKCERYEHEIDYRLWDIGSSKSL